MYRVRWSFPAVIALAGLGGLSMSAREVKGAIIVDAVSAVQVPDPTFIYQFHVTLKETIPGERIAPNDFFTIYDLQGMIPGTNNQPPNWAASYRLVGITPVNVAPTDDPNLLNVTWTYFGADPILSPADLGFFSVQTDSIATKTITYAGQTTLPDGTHTGNTGSVEVTFITPEPSALILAGIGAPFALFWLRRAIA